jgi:hypothetical protein
VIIGAGLTAFSPVILSRLAYADDVDWEHLSYIGRTHGAASAILSALALTGITLSLFFQA